MDGEEMKEQRKQKKARASLLNNVLLVNKTLFKNYPETMLLTPVYMICRVALPLLTAFIPSVAIAAITEGDTKRFLLMMVGILVAEAVAYILLSYSRMTLMNRRVYTRLKVFFLGYVRKSLTTDYENLEPAKGQAAFTKGAKAVVGNSWGPEKLMTESVEFVLHLIGLFTFGTVVFTLDYRILLILLFMFVLDTVLRGRAVKLDNEKRIIMSEVHRKQEYLERGSLTLEAGKDVRVYGMEGWFHQISEKLLSEALGYLKSSGLRWYLPTFGNHVCVAVQEIVTYFVLIGMALSGEITVAELTLQLGLVRGFTQWIYGVSVSYGALKKANGEMRDYREVMELPEKSRREGARIPAFSKGPEIEFRDVCFRYPGAEEDTLSNISFTMKPEEKIALVGNNGAGKTTLVKLLCGLYEPTSGGIYINGENINKFHTVEYQKLLSVVFQDASLLSFTIGMNVSGELPEAVDKGKVKNVLQAVGLWEKVEKLPQGMETYITRDLDEGGVQFSGGETQKLLVARAMYRNGPILILDEPTSALDPIAESKLYEEYNNMTKEKTAVFISHRLASTKFCDRILLLENGRIAEEGSHEELMEQRGHYRELFDIQSHYYKEGTVAENEE